LRTVSAILLAMAAGVAHAQSGQLAGCVQGPVGVPSILVSPAAPGANQPLTISVSPGDHSSFPNLVIASSVGAVINGQVINITINGFVFSPAPSHVNGTCGVVTFAGLTTGAYTVNFLLNVQSPNPPTIATSTTFVVSDQGTAIPTSGAYALAGVAVSILWLAYRRLGLTRRRRLEHE